jgi:hypothetical protein
MGAFFYEKESTQHVRVGSMAVQKIYRLIIISSVQAADIPKKICPNKKVGKKVVFFWVVVSCSWNLGWVVVVDLFFLEESKHTK